MNDLAISRKTAQERGYNSRWQKYRIGFLRKNPLCRMCAAVGVTTSATVVDHIEPHRGDTVKFWDKSNHQALCAECHDRHKQRIELTGVESGCGVDGLPLDKKHRWNNGK